MQSRCFDINLKNGKENINCNAALPHNFVLSLKQKLIHLHCLPC
jgi:hypothetical protein